MSLEDFFDDVASFFSDVATEIDDYLSMKVEEIGDYIEEKFDDFALKTESKIDDFLDGLDTAIVDETFLLNKGDVLAVKRFGYYHYAIYVGDDCVIHYAGKSGDWSESPTIHEASFKAFKRNSTDVYVLNFDDDIKRPRFSIYVEDIDNYHEKLRLKKPMWKNKRKQEIIDMLNGFREDSDYHLYSASETVERARRCIGEASYHLLFNNCEHFALWCKTGVKQSHQIDEILKLFLT